MTSTPHQNRALREAPWLAGSLVAALGAAVLLGWKFDVSALKSVIPGLVTMKANTAVALLLCGGALALLTARQAGKPARFCAATMAVVVIVLGMLTLGEYIFGWSLGLDQWLFRDPLDSVETSSPGCMSPATAFCLVLAGGAILVALRPVALRWGFPIIEAIAAALLIVGVFALAGFGLNALLGLRWGSHAGIAVHSAAAFMVLGGGLLALVKSQGGLKWSLGRLTTGGFALGIISLLTAVGISDHYTNQLQISAGWVVHTQVVLKTSGELTADVATLTSSLRSYINTGDERLLRKTDAMKGAICKNLDDLRTLTSDNPQQQERLRQINGLMARRFAWDDQVISVRRARGLVAAGDFVAGGEGLALSDSIRRLVQEIEAAEYSLLDQRQEKQAGISTTTLLLLPLGIFFSITLLCLGLFFLNAGVGERGRTEARLAAIVEFSDDAIIGKDLEGIVTSWNAGAERLFGYAAPEMIGQPITRLISALRQEEETGFLTRVRRGESERHFETERVRKDGSLVAVSVTISPVRDPSGKIIGASNVSRDITERKQIDLALLESNGSLEQKIRELSGQTKALRASEEKFRQMAENIDEIFWISTAKRAEMLYVSPAYEKIWGRTCQSLYEDPRSFINEIHEGDRQRVLDSQAGSGRGEPYGIEYRIVRPDGQIRWVHARSAAIRDESGVIYRQAGIVEDITRRKSTEDQLRQAQKMELVGQLAGGVAHDFNNLLMIIGASAELLLVNETILQPESREYLNDIAKATERASALSRQLLAFSRSQAVKMQVLDLNELLAKFTKLLGRILGENVRVHSEFGPALPSIKADAGMIEQIVMNLAVNARDAMPAGGALTIRTEMQDFGAAEVSRHPGSREGSFVCLSVSDAGSGIAPENMARIFEPFFSTKGPGKGTGLGLATVFGIAQQHGGWVGVSSQPGAGTTFRVFLPATAEQLAPADANPGKKIRGGGEKILVVEDDAALREVVTEILLGEGYSVLGAGSGPAARQAWKKDFRSIDLLLADMLVPGAETGLELAGVFRKEKPELKVVLMSGYTTQLVSSEMLSSKRLTFLRKPFLPHVLAEMVRASLDAREPLKINNGATVDGSASHGNQGSEKVEFEHAKAMS